MMKQINLDPYLKSHFLNLYSIALSDLEVETTELELLYKFGEQRGITKNEINDIIINADSNKTNCARKHREENRIPLRFCFDDMGRWKG